MAKIVRYLTLPTPKRRKTEERQKSLEEQQALEQQLKQLCWSRERELRVEDVRIVLMAGAEHRVLFDSAAVVPTAGRNLPPGTRTTPDGLFELQRHRKDTSALGQMLFGTSTIPPTSGAHSFKIHSVSDNRLMVSRFFRMGSASKRTGNSAASTPSASGIHDVTMTSSSHERKPPLPPGFRQGGWPELSNKQQPLSVHSLDGLGHAWRRCVTATDPPEIFQPIRHFRRMRQSSLNTDDGWTSSDWDSSSSGRMQSPPHRIYTSTRRSETLPRLSMQDDSMYWLSGPGGGRSYSAVGIGRSSGSTGQGREFGSEGSWGYGNSNGGGRAVGLSLVLPAEQRSFVLQHMPLLDAELRRLEGRLSIASADPAHFINNAYQAYTELARSICLLHNAPRLRRPAWLTVQRKPEDATFAEDFCAELSRLVEIIDTKNTQFFLSKLLSAVLMYHMSWIASVASPPDSDDGTAVSSGSCGSHLAQLLEVSGCMGGSSRAAKTVVCGSDQLLVGRILQVLSYFVRCSAIQQKGDERCANLPECQSFSPCEEPEGIGILEGSKLEMASSPPLSQPIPVHSSPPLHESTMMASSWCSLDSNHSTGWQPSLSSQSSSLSSSQVELSATSSGLGQSLLAGPSSQYSPHFVLSGLIQQGSPDLVRISDESSAYGGGGSSCSAAATPSMEEPLGGSLTPGGASASAAPWPLLPATAVTIVADVTDWSVRVLLEEGGMAELASPAECVIQMIETFRDVHSHGQLPASLTLSAVEDCLRSILQNASSLVELVESSHATRALSCDQVCSVISCDHSDLRLLLNVASVFCPDILSAVC